MKNELIAKAKPVELLKVELNVTDKELDMLMEVVKAYDPDFFEGYDFPLSASEKGLIGSLVKKGLVFNASEVEEGGHNFKPTEEAKKVLGLAPSIY